MHPPQTLFPLSKGPGRDKKWYSVQSLFSLCHKNTLRDLLLSGVLTELWIVGQCLKNKVSLAFYCAHVALQLRFFSCLLNILKIISLLLKESLT